jgi:hypothetical protein
MQRRQPVAPYGPTQSGRRVARRFGGTFCAAKTAKVLTKTNPAVEFSKESGRPPRRLPWDSKLTSAEADSYRNGLYLG